jgi:hypothetical protein
MASCLVAGCTPFKNDDATPEAGGSPLTEDGGTCDPSAPFLDIAPVDGLANVGLSLGGLRLSPDLRTGYFSVSGLTPGGVSNDLYTATRDSPTAPFGNIQSMGTGINVGVDELDPTVDREGRTLIFSRGRDTPGYPYALFGSTRPADVPFAGATALGGPFDMGNDETPYLTASGNLYFATSTASLSFDLEVAPPTGAGYGPSLALLGTVNTGNEELNPVVTSDELTLYYASNRTDGQSMYADQELPAYHVWTATRATTNDPFLSPRDLVEVNGAGSNFPTFVTDDGCTLYFSSDRGGTLRMYVATKRGD